MTTARFRRATESCLLTATQGCGQSTAALLQYEAGICVLNLFDSRKADNFNRMQNIVNRLFKYAVMSETVILQHIVVEKYFAAKLTENLHLIHLYTQNTKADEEN
jgi:hypothetical protein